MQKTHPSKRFTTTIHFSIIFLVITSLTGCTNWGGNSGGISVLKTNAVGEISRTENLSFEFNQDIVPDSLLNKWETIEWIKFKPELKGKFRWTSSNTLQFSPNSALTPSSDFEALLQPALEEYGTDKLAKQEIKFNTPYLELREAKAYWRRGQSSGTEAIIGCNLNFNYKVDPLDLAKHLSIKSGGKSLEPRFLTTSPSQNIELELLNQPKVEEEIDLNFIVSKGFSIPQSSWKSSEEMKVQAKLKPPTALSIISLDASHDGLEGQITVIASQQLKSESLKSLIKLNPKVAFQVDPTASGFIIRSEGFDVSKTYDLTISKNLKGVFNTELGEDYTSQISFGKLEPSIAFTDKGGVYLGKSGNRNIGLNIVNVETIKVEIAKVFENNIYTFLQSGKEWGYTYSENEITGESDYNEYRYFDFEKYGKKVYEIEIPARSLDRIGNIRLLKMDFVYNLDQFDGLYVVKVSDKDKNFVTDSKLIGFSDIGLIAKQDKNKIHVFANSIATATPISGIEINFISKTNQKLKTLKTNGDGTVVFNREKENLMDFEVGLITAKDKLADDFNYMVFNEVKVNSSRFDVGGKRGNSSGLEAFIYGDRDLYRPGETMNINGIVRDLDWQPVRNIPVVYKVLLPNGREFKTMRKTLNSQGAAGFSLQIPSSQVTGTYAIEMYTGNDLLLNSYMVGVEDFMPDRIKVALQDNEKWLSPGDSVSLRATATNLFGPPAANRNYEVELSLKRKHLRFKDFSGYIFNIDERREFGNQMVNGKTDANGKIKQSFFLPKEYEDAGILSGKFYVTVFDESGRPVNRIQHFEVATQDSYLGIGRQQDYYSTNQPLSLPLVAVNKEGKALANETAMVKIIRYKWKTVLESTSNGRYRYRSQKEEIVEEEKQFAIAGKETIYQFTPQHSGRYRIEVRHPNSKATVSSEFYAYDWRSVNSTSFEVNREGKVEIEMNKDKYQVGETADVIFKTPFEGRLIVTLESDEVIRTMDFNTDKKSKKVSFELVKSYLPNIYITATLIRPMGESGIPLTVAHGFAPLLVEDEDTKIPIELELVEKSRSKTRQKIKVKTDPNTKITLAVVDEGILQIKDYQTPNPHNYFFQKRALGVESYDLYPFLFPELVAANPLSGGGAMDLGKRVNPVNNKRVKLVSYWSGEQTADSNGNLEYEFSIPEFSGDLRVMALAYNETAFGSDDANMKVADPVVISSGVPLFLSPKDTAEVSFTISNTTDQSTSAQIKVSAGGPINVIGDPGETISLPPNGETRVIKRFAAAPEIGEAKIDIEVAALGENFSSSTDISVRPASSLQKRSGSGSVKAGETFKFEMDNNYLEESIDGKLVVSRSPMIELMDDFEYLIGYPHGCVEQTISRAFPQMYYYEIAKNIGKKTKTAEGATANNPNYNVQQAINKLSAMQLNSGALAYWSGGARESWWASVYAAHFLMEAKKAGFEVQEPSLNKLNRYLKQRLQKKETYTYYYYDSGGKRQKKEIVRREIPYTLFILAMAGKPDIPSMNYYKAKPELLSSDSKYMLSAAFAVIGDKQKFEAILPNSFGEEKSVKENGRSFSSPIRDQAIALNALLEADPDHHQIGAMTKHLISDYKKQRYKNTQERVFTLLALGKIAKQSNASNAEGELMVNGNLIAKVSDTTVELTYPDFDTKNMELSTSGTGNLYYFWQIEGLSADGSYVEEDNFLKVRRDIFNRDGKLITDGKFEQNDLVVVGITVETSDSQTLENVVISDILPACFEIENPRISELPEMEWIKVQHIPEHQDFRDDRIHLFTEASKSQKVFYYMVRAVSPGTYSMGPVSADAMYDGEYHSYHGARTIQVALKE